MSANNGGPAFPENGVRGSAVGGEGMSLRDYFAAKALQGMCSIVGVDFGGPEGAAKIAYKLADAMIAEREKAVRDELA